MAISLPTERQNHRFVPSDYLMTLMYIYVKSNLTAHAESSTDQLECSSCVVSFCSHAASQFHGTKRHVERVSCVPCGAKDPPERPYELLTSNHMSFQAVYESVLSNERILSSSSFCRLHIAFVSHLKTLEHRDCTGTSSMGNVPAQRYEPRGVAFVFSFPSPHSLHVRDFCQKSLLLLES